MSNKKIQLPFVVAPRREPITEMIGTEASGTFEMERKGYLTVAEKSFMQQAMSSDETMMVIARIAGKIGRERSVATEEVVGIIGSGDFSNEILAGYEEDINHLVTLTNNMQQRSKVLAATCLLIFRVSRDWSVEDTLELHPDLLDELYALYLEEDVKSLQAFDKKQEEKATKGGKK